jgi:hypothetical protein
MRLIGFREGALQGLAQVRQVVHVKASRPRAKAAVESWERTLGLTNTTCMRRRLAMAISAR